MTQYLQMTEAIVRDAAPIARQTFGSPEILHHKDRGDMATTADLAVEQQILARLQQAFPEHGIVAEETGVIRAEAPWQWILDPIDGTRYFAGGIPLYSISLALRHNGKTQVGIVYNPESDQMFTASKGNGSHLNGIPIHCSKVTELQKAELHVEIPNRHFEAAIQNEALEMLTRLMPRVERMRMLGVSACGLCYCALGGFDAYLNISTGSKEWDLAAGLLILEESGAMITRTKKNQIVGGPKPLHDALLAILPLAESQQ